MDVENDEQPKYLLSDAQPVIPLTVGSTRWLKKPYVKGMYPNAMTLHPWKWIYIERDQTKTGESRYRIEPDSKVTLSSGKA